MNKMGFQKLRVLLWLVVHQEVGFDYQNVR
jgi:hypothetical protein